MFSINLLHKEVDIIRHIHALVVFCVLGVITFSWGQGLSEYSCINRFPQDKIDLICLQQERPTMTQSLHRSFLSREIQFSGFANARYWYTQEENNISNLLARDSLVIGPGPDTFFIDTNYVQNGNIYIIGNGVLIVSGARLDLSGSIGAYGNGTAILQDGAHLHFNQYYVGQYYVWLTDNARFEAYDATVDANGVMHFAQLHKNSIYIAQRTYFPDWTFRKVFDRSTLMLEDVYHVGDFMVDDSCSVHLVRCDTLMPWFETPDGSIIDIIFPDPDSVDHFELSNNTPGVDHIGYNFVVDTCWHCWWSLETYPGCSVVVRNSEIRGSCVRIPGADTFHVYGIANYEFFSDLVVPLDDRHLEYVNTYVWWWNWYPLENTVFYIDSCVFGELIGKGSSETYATRCTHDGATITLSAIDSAFVSFIDGVSLSYVSSFQKSTLLMINSSVTPMWPYQSTNIAHHHSYILCINCDFDSLPFAVDTALVMFVSITEPDTVSINDSVPIIGSAWLSAGPFSTVTFQRYRIYWSPVGLSNWTIISESTHEAFDDTLGIWSTWGLDEGEYTLRLTMLNNAGDSLIALRNIILEPTGVKEDTEEQVKLTAVHLFPNYPNPFIHSTKIRYVLPRFSKVELVIYNILGKKIRTVINEFKAPGYYTIEWDGKDLNGMQLPNGIYFYQLKFGEQIKIKKCIILR